MPKGDIKLKEGRGGQLAQIWVEEPTDNGVNVGATHVHGGVETGGGSTSTPH